MQETETSRRRFLTLGGVAAAAAATGGGVGYLFGGRDSGGGLEQLDGPAKSADEALARLMAGNKRYVQGRSMPINEGNARRAEGVQGQKPFASIFSCVDSRVPPELVFDRGIGDLFVARTAGQVLDNAVLGSLQFGVAELKIPLLLVLGHEKCGAVKATIETLEAKASAPASINFLVESIAPAVRNAKPTIGEDHGDVLHNAVQANVDLVVAKLRTAPILVDAIASGTLRVVGGVYDLGSGAVRISVL